MGVSVRPVGGGDRAQGVASRAARGGRLERGGHSRAPRAPIRSRRSRPVDVGVEGRGADPEGAGQSRERQLVQADGVGERGGGRDHGLCVQAGAGHQRAARAIAASIAAGDRGGRSVTDDGSVGSSARSAWAERRSSALS